MSDTRSSPSMPTGEPEPELELIALRQSLPIDAVRRCISAEGLLKGTDFLERCMALTHGTGLDCEA